MWRALSRRRHERREAELAEAREYGFRVGYSAGYDEGYNEALFELGWRPLT